MSKGADIFIAYSMVLHGNICDPQSLYSLPRTSCVTYIFLAEIPETKTNFTVNANEHKKKNK